MSNQDTDYTLRVAVAGDMLAAFLAGKMTAMVVSTIKPATVTIG